MTRRKGEITLSIKNREYPHQVELPIPPGGFGKRFDEMTAFHRDLGVPEIYGSAGLERKWRFIRRCFTSEVAADAFTARFGGERLTLSAKPPRQLRKRL
jgi:hypothetical protein